MVKISDVVKCIQVPDKGKFFKGSRYKASYIIDGLGAFDENNELQGFSEYEFLWYFQFIQCPVSMLKDGK